MPLSRKLGASLAATRGENRSASAGTHAQPKAVRLRAPTVVRLERALAHNKLPPQVQGSIACFSHARATHEGRACQGTGAREAQSNHGDHDTGIVRRSSGAPSSRHAEAIGDECGEPVVAVPLLLLAFRRRPSLIVRFCGRCPFVATSVGTGLTSTCRILDPQSVDGGVDEALFPAPPSWFLRGRER